MNIRILCLLSLFSCLSLFSMEHVAEYTFRHAYAQDIPALLEIINNQAIHDRTKIVILPKKFREGALQSSVEKKRLFVALYNKTVVGYKKLFIVTDPLEKQEMLADEIRCLNNESQCSFAGHVIDGTFVRAAVPVDDLSNSVCIYNGGDFTVPAHRGKGINKKLTTYALHAIRADVITSVAQNNASSISMLYGITCANAGHYPGATSDRTPGIVSSFNDFLNESEGFCAARTFEHRRYHAFMPTFDPESHQCIPLPDDQSIPGFGCVLTYHMGGSHE